MLEHARSIVAAIGRRFRSRSVLELENLALCHQLHVLRRQRPGRPRLFTIDRLLWVWFYRLWPRSLDTMVLVKPANRRPMAPSGLPLVLALALTIRTAVSGSRDSQADPRDERRQSALGAPRIHGELLKLGIEISQARRQIYGATTR
jgi:putative transposase